MSYLIKHYYKVENHMAGVGMKINISDWIPGSLGGTHYYLLFNLLCHTYYKVDMKINISLSRWHILLQAMGSHLINDQGKDNS